MGLCYSVVLEKLFAWSTFEHHSKKQMERMKTRKAHDKHLTKLMRCISQIVKNI